MRIRVLAVLIFISLPLLSYGQSTLSFARVMQPSDFPTTGFALVNPGPADASVTFTLYGVDGTPQTAIQTPTIVKRGQISKLASELFPTARNAGWIQATSSTAGLQGFWFAGDFVTFADGAEAETSSAELVVPLVAPDSEINIANTGAQDVTVRLNLLNADGFDQAMPFLQLIKAKGFFKADVASIYQLDDLSAPTHMRITCPCTNASPFIATLIARNFIAAPSWAVANGVPASTSTLSISFPTFVDGPQGNANWKSILGVTNLSPVLPNDVKIEFVSETGTPILTTPPRTLPPNGGFRFSVRDFGLPAGYQSGWVRVTSVSGLPLTGFIAYADTVAGGVAVVPAQQDARRALLFAHIADLPPWLTGLALLNTNTSAANLQVFAMNPDGSLIGSGPLTLQPGAKTSKLLREVIPQTQTRATDGGFLFVQSDVPVFGIELFFSRNLQILANVPAGSGIDFVHP